MIPIAYKEHIEARELAIRCLVSMYKSGIDIGDREMFNSVLIRYGLLRDGFELDEQALIAEVQRRIR